MFDDIGKTIRISTTVESFKYSKVLDNFEK